MTDDLLKRASAALREETREADDGVRFTRARVLASLQQSQVRRRSRLAVLLPLAACFAAASAFGMASGRVPALVHSVTHALGLREEPAPPAAPARRKPPSTSPAPIAIPTPTPTPTPTAELAPLAAPPESPPPAEVATVSEQSPAPTRAPERTPHSKERVTALAASAAVKAEGPESTPTAAPAAQGDVSDRAHELYRVAHRTHFVDHDYVSALRAWDAYLEAAPNGRFVLEARYNRALCLVRVGRSSEARDALAPFANGKFAGYRQEEARALIDAIGH